MERYPCVPHPLLTNQEFTVLYQSLFVVLICHEARVPQWPWFYLHVFLSMLWDGFLQLVHVVVGNKATM